MLFTSLGFFFFAPLVVIIYFVIPGRMRPAMLLAASCLFYLSFGLRHIIPILLLSLVSYVGGLWLENKDSPLSRNRLTLLIIIPIAFLIVFKYLGFIINNISKVLIAAGGSGISLPVSIIQPLGLSYLALQAISYTVDVYGGKIKAEHNPVHFFLFIMFFPKVMSGPIERGESFLSQIKACPTYSLWDAARIRDGLTRMAWGYFLKLVIADRLGIFVDAVFNNVGDYGRIVLIAGMCGYSLQLCADFVGSMDIVMGLSKVLGFSLSENFCGPMFARTLTESWRRWHMSLGAWLRDYIYIPLGGSRGGQLRFLVNNMIVFAVSGLWHGAAWHFIFWGLLNGVYTCVEKLLPDGPGIPDALRVVRTWCLWGLVFMFFRADGMGVALTCLKRLITVSDIDFVRSGGIFELGLSGQYMIFLIFALIAMAVVEYIRYSRNSPDIAPLFGRLSICVRYPLLIILLMVIIIFGAYGPSYNAANFIYFGF